METDLLSKMEEFMTSIDQVKKYRETVVALGDFVLGFTLGIVAFLAFNMVLRVSSIFWFDIDPTEVGWNATVNFLILLAGFVYGLRKANDRVARLPAGQWRSNLNEGAPGAIKLLQDMKWENIFSDIHYAKLSFAIYGAIKIIAYWIIALIAVYVIGGYLAWTIYASVNNLTPYFAILALAIVLYLDRNDLRRRYEQVGKLDVLLWELRWFDHEFQRADFKT